MPVVFCTRTDVTHLFSNFIYLQDPHMHKGTYISRDVDFGAPTKFVRAKEKYFNPIQFFINKSLLIEKKCPGFNKFH